MQSFVTVRFALTFGKLQGWMLSTSPFFRPSSRGDYYPFEGYITFKGPSERGDVVHGFEREGMTCSGTGECRTVPPERESAQ